MSARRLIILGLMAFLTAHCQTRCAAHPGTLVSALVQVQPDGAWKLRLTLDVMAYALGAPPNHGDAKTIDALLDGPPAPLESALTDAKARFRQNFHLQNGGPDAVQEVMFPSAAQVQDSVKGLRVRLPVMATVTVSGHLPPGVRTLAFQFDETLGTVVLTTEFPYEEPISEPVDAGAWSEAQTVPSAASIAHSAAAFQSSAAEPSGSVAVAVTPPRPASKPNAPAPTKTPVKAAPVTMASPVPPAKQELPVTPPATKPTLKTPGVASVSRPVAQAMAAPKSPSAKPPISRPPASLTRRRSPAVLAARPVSPTQQSLATQQSPMTQTSPMTTQTPPSFSRRAGRFVRYVKMGFTHILPEGLDHILFVVGLFLMSARLMPLLKQVTAFTVAHSLTLALALYGVVHLPSSVVEPVIAASIAFVALENVFTAQVKAGRVAVVFGFGLIHGLGFAAALQGLGLRRADLLPALVGFNVGVELGQLTVVAAAFLVLGRFRNHPQYRRLVVVPASLAIAATALVWFVQRVS